MADAARIAISSRLLTDEIQILTGRTGFAGGVFGYTPVDATEGWYYKLTNVTTTTGDLIEGSFLQKKDSGIAVGTGSTAVHVADKVKFLWIYNTGTTDGSTVTTDSVYLNFDNVAAVNDGKDQFEIPAKTTWYCRVPSTLVGEVDAIAGQANAAGTGGGNVQCIVCAIIDDVA
jgi:hypothetical protein